MHGKHHCCGFFRNFWYFIEFKKKQSVNETTNVTKTQTIYIVYKR